jgi:hypothetical protein
LLGGSGPLQQPRLQDPQAVALPLRPLVLLLLGLLLLQALALLPQA